MMYKIMNTLFQFQKKYIITLMICLQKILSHNDILTIILNDLFILLIDNIKIYCLYDKSYIIFNNKLYCCTNTDNNDIEWLKNQKDLEQINKSNYYFNLINICKINEVKIDNIITIANNNHQTLIGTNKGLFIFGLDINHKKSKLNLIKKSKKISNKDVKFINIKNIKFITSQSNYFFIGTKHQLYGSRDFCFTKRKFHIKNINMISSGYLHTFLITDKNELFGFGNNRKHQLGFDNNDDQIGINNFEINYFRQINDIKNSYIVSCGYEHTMVLTLNDNLFGCGQNSVEQLSFDTKNHDRCEIKKFEIINNNSNILKNILSISCGRFHSLILTKDGLFNCGFLFYNFKMITKIYNNERIFKILPDIIPNDILKISCGAHHYLILTKNNLFIGGSTNYGELGLGSHYDDDFSLNYVYKKIK